jgi:hypothetical protein
MVSVRAAKLSDLDAIMLVEELSWSEGMRASREMMASRIEVFAEGTICAEADGQVVGVVCTCLINYDIDNPIPTWDEATDNGYIRSIYQLKGNTLYGVNLSVQPRAPKGTSKHLMLAAGRLAIQSNVRHIVLGGRIPRYHKHKHRMTPLEYIKAKNKAGKHIDPELALYAKAGFKVGQVLPGYFRDECSDDYGVMLYWRNPFHGMPFRKLLVKMLPYIVFK